MRYLGGKHRIGREISEILLKYGPPDKVKGYLEPFCGSLGVSKNMLNKDYRKYQLSDIQSDLIQLWKECQDGTFKLPRKVSEKTYKKFKNKPSPCAMKAYIGFGLSFCGIFFSSYIQNKDSRDYNKEITNSIKKIKPLIQQKNVKFKCQSYNKWKPKGLLIYCDPPYQNTTGYKSTGEFEHNKFWDKIREWSKNNIVVVSEYKAPRDFKCIWKRKLHVSVNNVNGTTYNTEKLFILRKST